MTLKHYSTTYRSGGMTYNSYGEYQRINAIDKQREHEKNKHKYGCIICKNNTDLQKTKKRIEDYLFFETGFKYIADDNSIAISKRKTVYTIYLSTINSGYLDSHHFNWWQFSAGCLSNAKTELIKDELRMLRNGSVTADYCNYFNEILKEIII